MSKKPNIEAMDGVGPFERDTDAFLCSIAISLKRIADKATEAPKWGRKSGMDPAEIAHLAATMTPQEIGRHLGVHPSSVYRALKKKEAMT